MIDDILIGGTRLELKKKTIKIFGNTKCFLNFYLGERVQMIHVIHIAPQVSQISRDIEIHEVFSFKKTKKIFQKRRKEKEKLFNATHLLLEYVVDEASVHNQNSKGYHRSGIDSPVCPNARRFSLIVTAEHSLRLPLFLGA